MNTPMPNQMENSIFDKLKPLLERCEKNNALLEDCGFGYTPYEVNWFLVDLLYHHLVVYPDSRVSVETWHEAGFSPDGATELYNPSIPEIFKVWQDQAKELNRLYSEDRNKARNL